MKEGVVVMLGELTSITLSDLDASKLVDGSEVVVATESKKRALIEDVKTTITSKEPWIEEKGRRAKKFRAEWMNEVYFKEWLRPHPTDETYCICIACDIRLRCGKSELEKHASGLKHCRRMDAMKENPNQTATHKLTVHADGSHPQASDHILCEENGTFYVATGDLTGMATGEVESVLSTALLKLAKHLDNNSEVAKKKMQIMEAEHTRRMQILNKELELRTLEVIIRQNELRRMNNCASTRGSNSVELADEEQY
ncbi:hypothetical protein ONE63_007735 [Megalurothrips usitatus]|uniref:Uncharacterized protein n=1 Tax=Megalurothrips usitatus TaxID=439358 RepID=A0AAV7XNL1_9NEOP|nr:hypothetical protein ONE63_007735 [Megalurothrips usitatus]